MKLLLIPLSVLMTLSTMTIHTALSAETTVRLITLDPGHFHAALVQKSMYPQVAPLVHVYAPAGQDLQEHLQRVTSFNQRATDPTHWEEKVYTGPDFLQKMVREKTGNVVVLAGNNLRKTEYIDRSIKGGFHVLADKPMAITPSGFKLLQKAFDRADDSKLLLYDIMTERFEIVSIIERELARMPQVFGTLEPGTPDEPAVEMESIHHFFKEVAGKPLIRPAWFFDVRQQGEAIQDVGTHLVDLVQWECFPDQTLDWNTDIKVLKANRWATRLTPEQFKRATGLHEYPRFLRKDVGADGTLAVFQNGDVTYAIRGHHAKVTALWRFEAPPGAKDTHHSVLRGTRSILRINQGEAEHYQATLYVEGRPGAAADQFESSLRSAVSKLAAIWPGLEVKQAGNAWQIVIPEKYQASHETHFAQVTENFLKYLQTGRLPDWEVPNMLAKYYTTTEAFRLSH